MGNSRDPRFTVVLLVAAMAVLLTTCRGKSPETAPAATLLSPARIADGGAVLWVTDPGSGAVCNVDRQTLQPASCFTVSGTPLGIAWNKDRLFIGNAVTHAVEIYAPDGSMLSTLPGTYTTPTDLAVDDRNGLLFVLDSSAKTISVLTLSGTPQLTITGTSSGNGKLLYPVALTVDPARQEVLVSDYGDIFASFGSDPGWVRIYSYAGAFISAVKGSTSGFSRPQGLCVAGGRIFLTDAWRGQVLIITRQSDTLTAVAGSLGSFGDQAGQLMLPLDTVVAPDSGDVFVTNNRPGRIERFAGGGLVP